MPTPFEAYLIGRGLSRSTAKTYARVIRRLQTWLEEEGLSVETVSYRDVVAYVSTLDVGTRTKNLHLTALRYYMAFAVRQGRRAANPAIGLAIRGTVRRLPHDLLSEEQLSAIYRSQGEATALALRDKAILSVLIYQAVRTDELARLSVDHLDLVRGLIHIPSAKRSNRRTLPMEPSQVLVLHRYLIEARPALLRRTGKTTRALFFAVGSSHRLHNALARLMRRLRQEHECFTGAKQLRSSRIVLWLKEHDLRVVQQMAGHRYVSSTERYRACELGDLEEALRQHHPLG